MKEKEKTDDQFLFELATYMAVNARNVEDMPKYGSLRLITALSKLIDMPKYVKALKEDEFLNAVKEEIDCKKYLILKDKDVYVKFLDHLVELFYEHARTVL